MVTLQEQWCYFYSFIREPFENKMALMFQRVKQFWTAQSALFLSWLSRCPWVRRLSKYLMWNSWKLSIFSSWTGPSSVFIKKHTCIQIQKLHCLNLILLSQSTNIHWTFIVSSALYYALGTLLIKVFFPQGLWNHLFKVRNRTETEQIVTLNDTIGHCKVCILLSSSNTLYSSTYV